MSARPAQLRLADLARLLPPMRATLAARNAHAVQRVAAGIPRPPVQAPHGALDGREGAPPAREAPSTTSGPYGRL